MEYNKDRIYEFFQESILRIAKVTIDGKFTTAMYRDLITDEPILKDNALILKINNLPQFKTLLHKYANTFMDSNKEYSKCEKKYKEIVNDYEKVSTALANLFVNAGFEDYENPNKYIENRIKFLESDIDKPYQDWTLIGAFPGVKNAKIYFKIGEHECVYETPNKLDIKVERISAKNQAEYVNLPSMAFGIADDTAYVFTCQNPKEIEGQDKQLQKELNRARYKINENVDIEDQDVEPFAIISTTILSAFLQAENVNRIYVKNFLPRRYTIKHDYYVKKAALEKSNCEELMQKQQHIQDNLTYKFLKTFFRVSEQTNKIQQYSCVEPGFTIFTIPQNSSVEKHMSDTPSSPILQDFFSETLEACSQKIRHQNDMAEK